MSNKHTKKHNTRMIKICVCAALSFTLILQLAALLLVGESVRSIKSETDVLNGKLVSVNNEINIVKNEAAKLDKN